MFIPRQIQKKTAPRKRPTSTLVSSTTQSLPPPSKNTETKKVNTNLCANDGIDPAAARETVMSLEILLSDFSIGHVYGDWLRERMREVEGKDDCKLKNSHLLESQ